MPVGDMIPRVVPNLIGYTPPFGVASILTATQIFGESKVGASSKGGAWTPETGKTVQPDGVGGFDVSAWDDESGTKTLDGTAAPPALAIGALDGHDGVRGDGSSEYMRLTGLGWGAGDRPSLMSVFAWHDVVDESAVMAELVDVGANQLYFAWLRTNSTFDSSLMVTPAGNNSTYAGTPEASGDTAPHLHECHLYAGGGRVALDAVETALGDSSALSEACAEFWLLAWSGGGGDLFTDATCMEVVIADAPSTSEVADYRNQRVAAKYPTVGAQF